MMPSPSGQAGTSAGGTVICTQLCQSAFLVIWRNFPMDGYDYITAWTDQLSTPFVQSVAMPPKGPPPAVHLIQEQNTTPLRWPAWPGRGRQSHFVTMQKFRFTRI